MIVNSYLLKILDNEQITEIYTKISLGDYEANNLW